MTPRINRFKLGLAVLAMLFLAGQVAAENKTLDFEELFGHPQASEWTKDMTEEEIEDLLNPPIMTRGALVNVHFLIACTSAEAVVKFQARQTKNLSCFGGGSKAAKVVMEENRTTITAWVRPYNSTGSFKKCVYRIGQAPSDDTCAKNGGKVRVRLTPR